MAPLVNDDSPATLDEFKPPPNVVLPPRDIRTVLEKTAGYVARNGVVFEDRIREKERQNPKFSFLNEADAYHPFYQWRLSEIRAGRGTDISAGRAGAAAPEKPKGPPKPPDFEFLARMPRMSQKDLDVVRLTALFVAKNGRQWMTQLAQREASNAQFQFLIPSHTFHSFFQHLVDQYTILLRESGLDGEGGKLRNERIAQLTKNVEDKYHIVARAKQRAEYDKYEAMQRKMREDEEASKQAEFEQIDWNDFVVVETITFTAADETAKLPPPTSLSDLQYASLEEKNKISISANMRIEEAMPTDDSTTPPPSAHTLPIHPGQAQTPLPLAPIPQLSGPRLPESGAAAHHLPIPSRSAQEEEEERRIQERMEARARTQQVQAEARNGPAQVKIKENYIPKAAQRGANRMNGQMSLCPTCQQMIPVDEMTEHMRIEMLDPRWKEQKAKAESRYASTNISTVDVANNLKRLASQRSDVFDVITGQPISEEEASRRKKATMMTVEREDPKNELGPQDPLPKLSVEEQIKAIRDKFGAKS